MIMNISCLLRCTTLLLILVISALELSDALRDVRVNVPHAVRRGERTLLRCYYDIEDDNLYSVKWYKGRREFYRYTPKENPPMKIFHFPGVRVERYASNESQLTLDTVTMATAGKYSCEVSADAPSFHTLIASGDLEVVEAPHNPPFITGIRQRYRIDDIVRGNCTSRHSRPAANLTWTINNEEVSPAHLRHYKIIRDIRTDMETTILGLHFRITANHFENNKMKLRCIAQIHNVYWKSTEKAITNLEHYRKLSAANSVNVIQHTPVEPDETPYDQYALHDSELHGKKNNENNYLLQLQDFLFQFLPLGNKQHDEHQSLQSAWGTTSAATSTQHRAAYLPHAMLMMMVALRLTLPLLDFYCERNGESVTRRTKCNRIIENSIRRKQFMATASRRSCCSRSHCRRLGNIANLCRVQRLKLNT